MHLLYLAWICGRVRIEEHKPYWDNYRWTNSNIIATEINDDLCNYHNYQRVYSVVSSLTMEVYGRLLKNDIWKFVASIFYDYIAK